jgi:hypothetical protein
MLYIIIKILDYGTASEAAPNNNWVNINRFVTGRKATLHRNMRPGDQQFKVDITVKEFAEQLYSMAKLVNPSPAKYPIYSRGTFLGVLRIAVKALVAHCPEHQDFDMFAVRIIAKVLELNHIRMAPWGMPHQGQRGAPPRTLCWDRWALLNVSCALIPLSQLDSDEYEAMVEEQFEQQAADDDASAPWTTEGHDFKQVAALIICKQSLPDDWAVQTSTAAWINAHYQWVKEHYNGSNKLHCLAMLVGFVVGQLSRSGKSSSDRS